MKAMILELLGEVKPPQAPLRLVQHPEPEPAPGEVLLRVTRCGVCHTELDEIEGRTPPPQLPVVPGHQVVGQVMEFATYHWKTNNIPKQAYEPLDFILASVSEWPGLRLRVVTASTACRGRKIFVLT